MPVSLWLVTLVQRWLLPVTFPVPVGKVSASWGSASIPPPLRSWDLAGKLGGRLFSGLGIKAGHCRDGGGLKEGNSLLGV